MTTIREFNDRLPSIIVDKYIGLFVSKLGDQFESETNHDSKSVSVTKIPENNKEELTRLMDTQGYEVSYNEAI